jgi:hypothetical protein
MINKSSTKKITMAILAAVLAVSALVPLTTVMAASPARQASASAPQAFAGDNFYPLTALSRIFGPEVAKGSPLPQSVRSLFGDNLNAFFDTQALAMNPLQSAALSRVPESVHEIRGF